MKPSGFVVGIDEVGRGALAGPVVVAAAAIIGRPGAIPPRKLGLGALKDSKKLSMQQREAWYAYFAVHPNIVFAVARVYPRQIEKRNISSAANLAARRAFKKVLMREKLMKNMWLAAFSENTMPVFLDGGLYLGSRAWQTANIRNAKTIVKADEKIAAVKIASIIAKVHRDRFMVKLAKQYPAYGFEIHKGYGTQRHLGALKKYGSSESHRATFI